MSRDEILLFFVTIFATIAITATVLIPAPHGPRDLFVAIFLDAILWIAYLNYRIS